VPAIVSWLAAVFAPHRRDQTIREMEAAQPSPGSPGTPAPDTRAVIAGCDAKLARYQAALDGGADPQAVAMWTRQVEADRAAALAHDDAQARRQPGRRLTAGDMRALITSLGDLRDIVRDAAPADKAAIYDQLGLKITFKPGKAQSGRSYHRPGKICGAYGAMWGYGSCPRGDLNPHALLGH
jgi:site-specific DNA recombinase